MRRPKSAGVEWVEAETRYGFKQTGNAHLDERIAEDINRAAHVRESLKVLSNPHLTEDMMHNFGEIPKPKGSPSSRPK